MTVLDDVRNFITHHAPEPVCDDCIADRLKLSVRQHANHKTCELSKMPGFIRRLGTCGICNNQKLVIRSANKKDSI